MSTLPAEWAGDDRPSALSLVPVALEEIKRHPVRLFGLFAAIALLALTAGFVLPRKYVASTTILVEQGNIIAPLMEGRAVPTGVANRASIAKEVAFSRRVVNDVLEAGGWLEANPTPLARERLAEQVTGRTQITNPGENLIQITYSDSDPQRAYRVTKSFGDLIISESLAAKSRESRDAFEFIESQVGLYHAKLTEAEANLERYRTQNPDARPGTDVDVNARIGELRRQVESSRMDLMDLRSQEGALRSQLSGENEISVVQTRVGQIQARLAELQTQRSGLLLNFTEQHPDVVRTEHQIRDLEAELKREAQRQETRTASDPSALDGSAMFNPLYAELRSKIADARRHGAAAASRIGAGESLLAQELERSRRIASSESRLAELTRDYEVNRDLYQDLLKRRENARVSMNLDDERQGLSFRIQEPASVPLRPSGLRLMHVAGAGLLAACVVPLALLLGMIKFDSRVRTPVQIQRDAGLPVLGVVPAFMTRRRRAQSRRQIVLASLLFLIVPAVYGLALAMKLVHVL
ncbi:XrtA system polysaccharide chain length determinant [Novilysobacter ciconiae]|uniref:XrtA system polysaccharide chain length determinant n=1 Tax=Novilysobacter ciconiae TaxID=2781022 RepID=UPI001D16B659|nr:XrtA system polysaccharide chain length determinant [Lysobacter ciconiae]